MPDDKCLKDLQARYCRKISPEFDNFNYLETP